MIDDVILIFRLLCPSENSVLICGPFICWGLRLTGSGRELSSTGRSKSLTLNGVPRIRDHEKSDIVKMYILRLFTGDHGKISRPKVLARRVGLDDGRQITRPDLLP
jgi:hypothetical protein